jgi:PIN domain nuclease of toxin-antitoxin system
MLWEIAKLHQKAGLQLGLDSPLSRVFAHRRLHVWPVSREVCLNLAALDSTSDPADELIASTRDEGIRTPTLVKFA